MKSRTKTPYKKARERLEEARHQAAVDHSQMLGDVQEIYGYDYKAQSSNTANKRNNAK